MEKLNEQSLEQLNPFEISSVMMEEAKRAGKAKLHDAGRGNPNWINIEARRAFALLLEFGCSDARELPISKDIVGVPGNQGIFRRLKDFLVQQESETALFLLSILQFAEQQGWPADEFAAEMIHGVIGDNYPVPSRCLKFTEKVLNLYFEKILYGNKGLYKSSAIFPTEGGTAAIVYIFNSLKQNFFIKNGDKIAMNTPIFTPYLDIPGINDYELVELNVQSQEDKEWTIPLEALEVLKSPEIKVFFLVNPSNPGAMALSKEHLDKLEEVVQENPHLIVVTDDVYATYVNDFESIYARIPRNTILVYSFSKLYGATGWRIGDIIVHKENIFDDKIRQMPAEKKEK